MNNLQNEILNEKVKNIREVLAHFILENSDKDILNKKCRVLNENDKKILVELICLALIKSTVSKNVDIQLNNGYLLSHWEDLYFENLSLGESLTTDISKFKNQIKEHYINLCNAMNGETYTSEAYKKFGFIHNRSMYPDITKNFDMINYFFQKEQESFESNLLWIPQNELLFMTQPYVDRENLKILVNNLKLVEQIPVLQKHLLKKEDVKDIFNFELSQISPLFFNKELLKIKEERQKLENVNDRKMDDTEHLINLINPRLLLILKLVDKKAAEEFIGKFLDYAFKEKSEDDINLPLIAISFHLLNSYNSKVKNSTDVISLNDEQVGKIINFSTIKKIDEQTTEIYFDIKQMAILKTLIGLNDNIKNIVGGNLEFVNESIRDNRIPHRKLTNYINKKLADNNNASLIVEEEEQNGVLTGLYFVVKNVHNNELLEKCLTKYFVKYNYALSDSTNISIINVLLNDLLHYEKLRFKKSKNSEFSLDDEVKKIDVSVKEDSGSKLLQNLKELKEMKEMSKPNKELIKSLEKAVIEMKNLKETKEMIEIIEMKNIKETKAVIEMKNLKETKEIIEAQEMLRKKKYYKR